MPTTGSCKTIVAILKTTTLRNLTLTFLIILTSVYQTWGQRNRMHEIQKVKINWDSTVTISKNQLDSIITKSTTLLKTKKLSEIGDQDHIDICRLYNTASMSYSSDSLALTNFLELLTEKKYVQNITNVYPDWMPNRGMGFYFPKLQIELGGTPHIISCFTVVSVPIAAIIGKWYSCDSLKNNIGDTLTLFRDSCSYITHGKVNNMEVSSTTTDYWEFQSSGKLLQTSKTKSNTFGIGENLKTGGNWSIDKNILHADQKYQIIDLNKEKLILLRIN